MTPRQLTIRDEVIAWTLFSVFGLGALVVLVCALGWAGAILALTVTGAGLASVVDP